jgi:hypothetical protein
MAHSAKSFFRTSFFRGAVLVALLPFGEALADDSIANLDAGGLVLDKTDQIELRAEDLYLSAKQVRVSYRFFNKTDQDLNLTVAFPMPDVTGEQDLMVAIPNPTSPNFLNFQTRVGGKPVDATVEQRAFFTPDGGKETEITDLLKGLNIPLMPIGDATAAVLMKLSPGDRQKLAGPGYISAGGDTITALWTLRSKFYHQQVFPSKKEIVVEQTYAPSVGAASGVYFDKTNLTGESLTQYQKKYCTDAGFLRAADLLTKRIAAAQAKGANLPRDLRTEQTYFGYVITSGGNWAGPIGKFHLVIDKAYADNLVSFCGDGFKKVSGTRYETTKTNYLPDRNIDVLILDKHAVR